jgi:DNA-binding NarL/FixJ family response regulator
MKVADETPFLQYSITPSLRTNMRVTVAIVEDNEEIAQRLSRVVGRDKQLNYLCTCGSGELALEALPKQRPDVVIMDLQLPGMSGIECTARLRQLLPDSHVLVFTVYRDDEQVFKALKAGASGYLLKRSTAEEILEAIHDVHHGGAPMTGEIAAKVVRSFRTPLKSVDGAGPEEKDSERLTPRQEEILGLLARGFVSKEIATELGISYDTVRFHLKDIYAKLHVRSRTEAVAKYLR